MQCDDHVGFYIFIHCMVHIFGIAVSYSMLVTPSVCSNIDIMELLLFNFRTTQ
jgi:hypothetical protein